MIQYMKKTAKPASRQLLNSKDRAYWCLAQASGGYSGSNISCQATYLTYNTVKLLTVICLSITVSPACIDRTTKAVSLSVTANKSTFVMSPRNNKAAAHNTAHSVQLSDLSVEKQQVCLCVSVQDVHLPASEHMNKRLCYGPVNQFTEYDVV